MIFCKVSVHARSALLCLFWTLAFSLPAHALSVPGLVGTYGVTERTDFSVDGFGQNSVRGDGNCTITDRDETSGGLFCRGFDPSQGQNYSGGLSTLKRRKKLAWGLDSAGLDQVKANLTQWLIARNLKKGRILEPENVTYEFDRLKYEPIKLTQGQSQPVAAKGVLKGRAVQIVNGQYIVKPFTYSIKIKFIARAP